MLEAAAPQQQRQQLLLLVLVLALPRQVAARLAPLQLLPPAQQPQLALAWRRRWRLAEAAPALLQVAPLPASPPPPPPQQQQQ